MHKHKSFQLVLATMRWNVPISGIICDKVVWNFFKLCTYSKTATGTETSEHFKASSSSVRRLPKNSFLSVHISVHVAWIFLRFFTINQYDAIFWGHAENVGEKIRRRELHLSVEFLLLSLISRCFSGLWCWFDKSTMNGFLLSAVAIMLFAMICNRVLSGWPAAFWNPLLRT